jgi:hypothetical protein
MLIKTKIMMNVDHNLIRLEHVNGGCFCMCCMSDQSNAIINWTLVGRMMPSDVSYLSQIIAVEYQQGS